MKSPMLAAGLTPRPAALPPGVSWCAKHAVHYTPKALGFCGPCRVGLAATQQPAATKQRSTAGHAAEDALARQFEIAGYCDTTHAERTTAARCFRRQHPWGLRLDPRRGFAADFAFLGARVLVEIVGGAHAAGRSKVRADVERSGLSASIGWTIVPVTPEQVRDGEAMKVIEAALAAKEAT